MLAGELYDPLDPELVAAREHARDLCQALNATREAEHELRRRILRELFGKGGESVWMQPPFFCDYGSNIELGERVFFNFNCVVLDVCHVRIGDHAVRAGGADLHADASIQCRTAPATGIREANRNRFRRLGGWGSAHSSRRANRIALRHRCGQRRHTGRSRWRVCRRQPLSGHQRDCRVSGLSTDSLRSFLTGVKDRRPTQRRWGSETRSENFSSSSIRTWQEDL